MTEGRCGELGSQPRTEPAVWPGNGDQPPGPALGQASSPAGLPASGQLAAGQSRAARAAVPDPGPRRTLTGSGQGSPGMTLGSTCPPAGLP